MELRRSIGTVGEHMECQTQEEPIWDENVAEASNQNWQIKQENTCSICENGMQNPKIRGN